MTSRDVSILNSARIQRLTFGDVIKIQWNNIQLYLFSKLNLFHVLFKPLISLEIIVNVINIWKIIVDDAGYIDAYGVHAAS
ncbi:hypothetical protein OUZ56_014781 [Daphnia magna]|uniref:Uncharacterized protein n=1 Tax=Daphnia magna TaxID=35525 RepID=A0ABR0AKT6_9CRUS|nr:hypothetical protein OUZ56_014781 [Daphnia magna]